MVLFSSSRGVTRSVLIGLLISSFPVTHAPLYAQDGGNIVIQGKPDSNKKKVCRIVDPPTGSRIGGGRVCRAAADWRLEEDQAQRAVQQDVERQRAMDAYRQNQQGGLPVPGPP